MGPCQSGSGASSNRHQNIWKTNPQLCESQADILRLIHADLAARTGSSRVSMEDFLLFFHKNGYWGNRLFKEFARDAHETDLSEEQFVNGIGMIYKSGEREKIMMLFKFFSRGQQGVGFQEFLTMLYNYPKQDLKEILNDKAFIEYELSKRLGTGTGETQRSESSAKVMRMNSMMMLKHHISMGGSQLARVTKSKEDSKIKEQKQRLKRKVTKETHGLESLVGGEIISKLNAKHLVQEQVIKLQAGGEKLEIKTINIQQVVKKFAYSVFDEAEVDPQGGTLSFEKFCNWISNHQALYLQYYSGFHAEVWENNPKTKRPRYLTEPCEKTDIVNTTVSSADSKQTYAFCQIFLFHSILVVCPQRKLLKPVAVVCLQGLTVVRILEEGKGYGVEMTHREGLYPPRKVFFKDEKVLDEWMEVFKFCKGDSVRQKYKFGEKIGTGKFSVVYKGSQVQSGMKVAIKEIINLLLDDEARQLIAHQSSIMQVVDHPLLLCFRQSIQTRTHIFIITELVEGPDLFDFVQARHTLSQKDAAKITQQLIVGLSYLHSLEIVHRDLKPENIMVVTDEKTGCVEYVKVIDFGFSNYLSKLNEQSGEANLCGTPNYIAPQVLRGDPVDFAIDNFAIGVILFFMLTHSLPFNDYQLSDILQNTKNGLWQYPPQVNISSEAKDLIQRLIKNDPAERISLVDALKHPWFDILGKHPHSNGVQK